MSNTLNTNPLEAELFVTELVLTSTTTVLISATKQYCCNAVFPGRGCQSSDNYISIARKIRIQGIVYAIFFNMVIHTYTHNMIYISFQNFLSLSHIPMNSEEDSSSPSRHRRQLVDFRSR
ncbi:jg16888 [Pararge aegeria aegeria]|uniref:Jg16888 protein n=1 Tax=Pararge aegeria aegeria TaxID=348720 RepID=A0A8S4SLX2_9NEOP|nr:jg16888 [Pararge aegeria aegeria]